ncbi:hypothetical protein KCU88_g407, partial [Aureobasidium melanogenum]
MDLLSKYPIPPQPTLVTATAARDWLTARKKEALVDGLASRPLPRPHMPLLSFLKIGNSFALASNLTQPPPDQTTPI